MIHADDTEETVSSASTSKNKEEKHDKDPIEVESTIWAERTPAPEWKPTDQELPRYVFSGRLKYLPLPANKVVKIFLSSTFTDMYVERNYLLTEIYPRLQQFCQNEYSLEFQVVDMRWGVRDEAQQDHSGSKTCMDELRSCQELSLGPNFVCLLGQSYGNRPLQSEISLHDWEIIVSALESLGGEGLNLLKDWYQRDDNGIPATMILMPLNERCPVVQEKQFSDEISPKLHAYLRNGVQKAVDDKLMDEKQAKKYFWSVTEEEVYNGVLSLFEEEARNHTLCFVRNLVNINYQDDKADRFVELEQVDDKVENRETSKMIKDLIMATKKHLGAENSFTFADVEWNDMKSANMESLKGYLIEFGEKFEKEIKNIIRRAADKKNPIKGHSLAGMLTEIAEHDHQALAKNKTLQGRADIMATIRTYIHSESTFPFIMYGDSGFSKTSLLAVASIRVYDWLGDTGKEDLVVVRRFLGTTPDSTNIGSLIDSITIQISNACQFVLPQTKDLMQKLVLTLISIPKNYRVVISLMSFCHDRFVPPQTKDPMQKLVLTLISIPKNYRVVIFLDSLDQLSAYGKAHTLEWLPDQLPSNVKLLVSTLPEDHNILNLLKNRHYSDKQYVEVKILDTQLALKLIKDWLRSCKRQLIEDQFTILSERFETDANTSPLYIKLIFDVIITVPFYVDDIMLKDLLLKINSPVQCIRYIFNELKRKNGDLLVHRLFAYLHLSNLGLTENELIDLISLDDEVLNDVFQYQVPPLRRLPAVLWARIRNSVKDYMVTREANGGKVIAWYHRQFVEVGDTMFKDEPPVEGYKIQASHLCNLLRESMVDYFSVITFFLLSPVYNLNDIVNHDDRKEEVQDNFSLFGVYCLQVFGDIEGLTGLFGMYSWSEICEMTSRISFKNQKAIGKDKDETIDSGELENSFDKLFRAFMFSSSLLSVYPRMLGPITLGRLLAFAPGSELISNFVNGVYEKGPKINSFVCPHPQLEGSGTHLVMEMPNDHSGPCVAVIMLTPLDGSFYLTLSRKAVLTNVEEKRSLNGSERDR
ncbi:NACHT and WD repeat domain-containing protein 2-like [Watersipora subatra]|uniref:NACHT and WD repeat domain-containing protein 2-like n=1 Tax=Watersipora subatra TaxID=2589382 RepID=UPI00355C4E2B